MENVYSHLFAAVVPVLVPLLPATPGNRELRSVVLRVATWRDYQCAALDPILHQEREFIRCAKLAEIGVLDLTRTAQGYAIEDPRDGFPCVQFDANLVQTTHLDFPAKADFLYWYLRRRLFALHVRFHRYKHAHGYTSAVARWPTVLPRSLDSTDRVSEMVTRLIPGLGLLVLDVDTSAPLDARSVLEEKLLDPLLARELECLQFLREFKEIVYRHPLDPELQEALVDGWAVDAVFHRSPDNDPATVINPAYLSGGSSDPRRAEDEHYASQLSRWKGYADNLVVRLQKAYQPELAAEMAELRSRYDADWFETTHL
jgi:hypothetical protein